MAIVQIPAACDPTSVGLRLTKGDTRSVRFVLGQDLTGDTVALVVKRNPITTDVMLTKAGVIEDAPTGAIRFDFVPADVVAIPAGFYVFLIRVTTSTPTVSTAMTGQLVLDPFDQQLVGLIEPHMRLALTKTTERLSIEIRDDQGVLANPAELSLLILDFSDNVIQSTVYPDAVLVNPEGGIFYFDFTTLRAGDYLVRWTYRFSGSEPVSLIRNVRFVTPAMYRMIPEVLLYIDKSRKALGSPIGFASQDVAEYIQNALRDFNATSPTTTIMLENLDGILGIYKEVIILGSVIQALIAQGLLAVDQDFVYNDQGISLQIEHSSKLLSWYSALLQQYTTKKMMYKMEFYEPAVYARSIVGATFALGFSHIPPGTAVRFRGWI